MADVTYTAGLLVVAIGLVVGFAAIVREKDDLHRILLTDLAEILALILVADGIILSGVTGGAVAAVGAVFYFMCRGHAEQFELIETVSGYAWAIWIGAFFIFMFLPQYWFFAVMMAGGAILLKVMAKMSLVGTMRRGGPDV